MATAAGTGGSRYLTLQYDVQGKNKIYYFIIKSIAQH